MRDPNKVELDEYRWEKCERCNRVGFYDPHGCRVNPDISNSINLRGSKSRWSRPKDNCSECRRPEGTGHKLDCSHGGVW